MSKCKGCGAQIIWLRTLSGKLMPCDPKPVRVHAEEDGPVKIVTADGCLVSGTPVGKEAKIVTVGYIPHWSTCPAARKFHGGKGR